MPCADDRFSYPRLPGPNWTRVLVLHPAQSPDDPEAPPPPLHCSLEPIKIDADSKQQYEALSYVWALGTSYHEIRCSGKLLQIGANLHKALHRIRDPVEARILWVDAVCINQSDLKEQGEQVKRMDGIYANARKVLIWIGEEVRDQDAEDCFELIRQTNRFIATQLSVYGKLELIPPFTTDNIASDLKRWDKVSKLMESTYFTRVWVLQEVGLASKATILYGAAELNWAEIVELMLCIALRSDLSAITRPVNGELVVNTFESLWRTYSNSQSWRTEMYVTRMRGGPVEAQDFIDILNNGRFFNATNPRDHVYAFLGHPSATVASPMSGLESLRAKILEVDYTKNVDEVYLDTAKAIIARDKHPWTMLSCVDHPPEALSDISDRPSWVPYWNEGWRVYWLGYRSAWYRAGGQDQTVFKATPLLDQSLQLSGTCFSRVVWVSNVLETDDLRVGKPVDGTHPISAAWQQLVQHVKGRRSGTSHIFRATEHLRTLEDSFSLTITAGMGSNNSRAENDIEKHRALYSAYRKEADQALLSDQNGGHSPSGEAIQFQQRIITDSRRVFFTDAEQVGLGHNLIQDGDVCVVFRGAIIPFIIRHSRQQKRFKLVGECYIQGVMDGQIIELVDQGILQETDMYLV